MGDLQQSLTELLNSYSSISASGMETVIRSGSLHTYKKNEMILSEGRYDAFEYFQLAGISHRYNTDSELATITTGIYSGPIVITPHFARTKNHQSIFSVQALTGCNLFKVPIGVFDELRTTTAEIGTFGQRVVEREFTRSLNYEVLFRTYSAKQRLEYFRAHYAGLENSIPHSVIASYLGITTVSLSRLRNELARD